MNIAIWTMFYYTQAFQSFESACWLGSRLCLTIWNVDTFVLVSFYCFGDFPNVNPPGTPLSSFVQMCCNWLFVYNPVSSIFLNGSRQIRHTSKGPIVHCEYCVLNCKKKKKQLLNLWISAIGPAISTWKVELSSFIKLARVSSEFQTEQESLCFSPITFSNN